MEILDLYTKDREKTGLTFVRGSRQPVGYYRLVIHICIFNQRGQMLIQQRQPFKKGWGNLWDVSVGGAASSGDTSETAAARELAEELGVELDFSNIRPGLTVHSEFGFDDYYIVHKNLNLADLRLQESEVQAVRWADEKQILAMMEDGSFIPYKKSLISMLFELSELRGAHSQRG